jgi:inhibitor of KinA sporulation pathway (predicted exonuclease)
MIRYICVLDFEETCWEDPKIDKSKIEIIEFPSILYKLENNKLEKISEFHEYVKPVINPTLSEFCIKLTGIKQETVDKADVFSAVFNRHHKWLKELVPNMNELSFLTCGAWDLNTQLPRELINKKIKTKDAYSYFINIKDEYEYFYKTKAFGMDKMLQNLGLTLDGKHHSGIDDTRNISKILIKMVSDGHTDFKVNFVKNKN